MSDVNEDLIRNLYAKYAPEVDVDSKIEHIQNTYGNNQDSFVENFYRKYSPDTDVSGKLDYINSKYPVTEVKKKEETELVSDSQEEVMESTTEDGDESTSQASVLEEEVQEKKAISQYATVGIYTFSRGKDLVDAAIDMIINNDRVNNEFYTCPVYNYSIKNGARIGIYNIEFEKMHGLGTPEDLERYLHF